MALTYNSRAAEIMYHLVTHAAHGYSQPNRRGDGTIETLRLSDGTVTTVHGGDYDCSEAVRMCYVAAGVLPRGCYMWTGNEASLLKQHGFAGVGLGSLQVGDVLLRSGHTEMVISVGGRLMQAGFRISEHGTLSGAKGDQTGWESTYSALDAGRWRWAYRYVGGQPKAAQTAAPVTDATVSTSVPAGTYQCVVDALNVRSGAGTGYSVVAQYHKGETVRLDATAIVAGGCVWGRYTGGSGKLRWVAVRTTGGMEYMRKVSASAPKAPAKPAASVPAGRYTCQVSTLNVRSAPTTGSSVVAKYHRGQQVTLDGWSTTADGCVWGRYTGASSGRKRYVAVSKGGSVYLKR